MYPLLLTSCHQSNVAFRVILITSILFITCYSLSVTISILGTSAFTSKAVTRALNNFWQVSQQTTWSSSDISSPITATSLNISVMAPTCSCNKSPSFRRSEWSHHLNTSLLAHIFYWNWSLNFFHTATGSSGSPIRYNNDRSTDSTMVASALSFRETNLEYWFLSPESGVSSKPFTILQTPSHISAILHCIFQVG